MHGLHAMNMVVRTICGNHVGYRDGTQVVRQGSMNIDSLSQLTVKLDRSGTLNFSGRKLHIYFWVFFDSPVLELIL